MVPIVYFRSSSFNCHRMCEMQYYLEYTLGHRGLSGLKADKGTIVHKVLELVAVAKKTRQEGRKTFTDSQIGRVSASNESDEYIDKLVDRVYTFYTERLPHHPWKALDLKHCRAWTWKAIQFNDGMFDPRNRQVRDVEPHFDFEVDHAWADYKYDLSTEVLKGKLALKGTIDLITDLGDGMVEVIDWKTGKRLDWATGKEKTQESLKDDPQLRIYHYACKQLYPDVSTFLITIYFINDGGPFTLHFDDSDLPVTEKMLELKFNHIKKIEEPKLSRSWKCSKICHQGKSTFEGTNITPIKEFRPGQITPHGEFMTKCEQTRYLTRKHGIDWATENLVQLDHSFGKYKAPGEV